MTVVLASMLVQSVHSYEHFKAEASEKICLHKHNSDKDITHQHHNLDHCFVCEFTFASFITKDFQSFEFYKTITPTAYTFFYSKQITQFFRGSLFSHRGPPTYIA